MEYNFIEIMLFWILYENSVVICTSNYDKEICNWDTFNPICEGNSVIIIEKAFYGRLKIGSCGVNEENLGCHEEVIQVLESKCSGKSSCKIIIALELYPFNQCGDLEKYLEVTYSCQQIIASSSKLCQQCDGIRITQPEGYLSNLKAIETGCGSSDCPWLLVAPKGQTINITLIDFSYKPFSTIDDSSCEVYALLKEVSRNRKHIICKASTQKSSPYSSSGNLIEIRLSSMQSSSFLLYYQITGCADFEKPGMTFQRHGNRAVFKCNDVNKESYLFCRENIWVGEISSCSIIDSEKRNNENDERFYITIEMIIIITSCVSFTIGGCILILGIYIFCRERNLHSDHTAKQHRSRSSPVYDSYCNEPYQHSMFMNRTNNTLEINKSTISGPMSLDISNRSIDSTLPFVHSLRYPEKD